MVTFTLTYPSIHFLVSSLLLRELKEFLRFYCSVKMRSLPPSAVEETQPLLANMSSTNWTVRHESINEMAQFLRSKPRIFAAQAIKVCAQ